MIRNLVCTWFKHLICLWLLISYVTVISAVNEEVLSSNYFTITTGEESTVSLDNNFGNSIINIGNLDGLSDDDLAIGASRYLEGKGAVYIMFMNKGNAVKSQTLITQDSLNADLGNANFGSSLACMGDYNADSTSDILVGAPQYSQEVTSADKGAVFLLFLTSKMTIKQSTFCIFFVYIYIISSYVCVCANITADGMVNSFLSFYEELGDALFGAALTFYSESDEFGETTDYAVVGAPEYSTTSSAYGALLIISWTDYIVESNEFTGGSTLLIVDATSGGGHFTAVLSAHSKFGCAIDQMGNNPDNFLTNQNLVIYEHV